MGKEKIDTQKILRRLSKMTKSSDTIKGMASYLMQFNRWPREIVEIWQVAMKAASTDRNKLTLLYLANEILQTCSKNGAVEFRDAWYDVLPDAFKHMHGSSFLEKIIRILNIWGERGVYGSDYIKRLTAFVSPKEAAKTPEDLEQKIIREYKPENTLGALRALVQMEKQYTRHEQEATRLEGVCPLDVNLELLKNKEHGREMLRRLDDWCKELNKVCRALEVLHSAQKSVGPHLKKADLFYSAQNKEAEVVVTAYRNYGSRLTQVKEVLSHQHNQSKSHTHVDDLTPYVTSSTGDALADVSWWSDNTETPEEDAFFVGVAKQKRSSHDELGYHHTVTSPTISTSGIRTQNPIAIISSLTGLGKLNKQSSTEGATKKTAEPAHISTKVSTNPIKQEHPPKPAPQSSPQSIPVCGPVSDQEQHHIPVVQHTTAHTGPSRDTKRRSKDSGSWEGHKRLDMGPSRGRDSPRHTHRDHPPPRPPPAPTPLPVPPPVTKETEEDDGGATPTQDEPSTPPVVAPFPPIFQQAMGAQAGIRIPSHPPPPMQTAFVHLPSSGPQTTPFSHGLNAAVNVPPPTLPIGPWSSWKQSFHTTPLPPVNPSAPSSSLMLISPPVPPPHTVGAPSSIRPPSLGQNVGVVSASGIGVIVSSKPSGASSHGPPTSSTVILSPGPKPFLRGGPRPMGGRPGFRPYNTGGYRGRGYFRNQTKTFRPQDPSQHFFK